MSLFWPARARVDPGRLALSHRQRCDIVRLDRQLCSLCPADTSAEPNLTGHGSSEAVPTVSSSPLSQDSPRRPAASVSIVACAVVPVVEAVSISDHRVGSYNRRQSGFGAMALRAAPGTSDSRLPRLTTRFESHSTTWLSRPVTSRRAWPLVPASVAAVGSYNCTSPQ